MQRVHLNLKAIVLVILSVNLHAKIRENGTSKWHHKFWHLHVLVCFRFNKLREHIYQPKASRTLAERQNSIKWSILLNCFNNSHSRLFSSSVGSKFLFILSSELIFEVFLPLPISFDLIIRLLFFKLYLFLRYKVINVLPPLLKRWFKASAD